MFISSSVANIRFSNIAMFPTKVRLNVKNNKHHSTFNTPFIISSTSVFAGRFDFDTHIDSMIPNVIYIMVHIIGIRISGIH